MGRNFLSLTGLFEFLSLIFNFVFYNLIIRDKFLTWKFMSLIFFLCQMTPYLIQRWIFRVRNLSLNFFCAKRRHFLTSLTQPIPPKLPIFVFDLPQAHTKLPSSSTPPVEVHRGLESSQGPPSSSSCHLLFSDWGLRFLFNSYTGKMQNTFCSSFDFVWEFLYLHIYSLETIWVHCSAFHRNFDPTN